MTLDPGHICRCQRKDKLKARGVRPRPFLVTGCGRSGTRFVADLLTAVDVPTGWERTMDPMRSPEHRARDYKYILNRLGIYGDSNWLAVPYLRRIPNDVVVIHLVRHPLKVIRSFLNLRFFGDDVIRCGWRGDSCHTVLPAAHLPGFRRLSTVIERCMYYWLGWNQLCETMATAGGFATYRFCLEDLAISFEQLATGTTGVWCRNSIFGFWHRLGLSWEELKPANLPKNRSKQLSGSKGLFTWDDLPDGGLKDDIRDLAFRYGYTDDR